MYVAGDVVADAGTFQWIPFAASQTVLLVDFRGDHTVTVKFKDATGNEGDTVSAVIEY
jgi:hypothetical protein